MHFKSVTALLATAAVGINAQERATGQLGDAKVVTNNPAGVVYEAVLPDTAFTKGSAYADGGNVKGVVKAVAGPDGVGVVFKVEFSNLPKEGGPFKYHIHAMPVPADGNCTGTLAHLDPYIRGETPPCNSSTPEACEVGDLSGKHGEVKQDPFTATYTDQFASTHEGIGAFFGNRSFVFHYANKTRISCANFTRKQVHHGGGGGGGGGGYNNCSTSAATSAATAGATPDPTGATVPTPTSSPPAFTAGAATLGAGMAGFLAAAAAALL